MTAETVLAIDLGTQSLRVSALSTAGARLWTWSRPVASIVDGLRYEQDPEAWRDALMTGLGEAAKAGIRPEAIAACGPLAGYVAIGADGRELSRAVMYNDGRSAADIPAVEAATEASPLRVAAADPLPQVLRLRREAPDLVARTRHLLDATGWLNFVLTGAATLNTYTALRLYTPEVRRALGVADMPVGRTVATGAVIGRLLPALATRFGFAEVPVVAAPFDSKSAYIASGIAAPGAALDISGTVTSFGVVSARAVHDPARRIYSVPLGDSYLVRGSTAAAGSVLEWARDLLGIDFATFDRLAESAAPGAGGAILLPYHAGARAPLWRPLARGVFCGLSLATGRAETARAVYEGLALSLRHIVTTIEACGAPVGEIRLSGGLARNATLAQIKADILGKPLVALADAELTTLGLAVIASVALGAYADTRAASAAFVKDGRRFTPNADRAAADRLYAAYVAAAEAAAGKVAQPVATRPGARRVTGQAGAWSAPAKRRASAAMRNEADRRR